jgi:hypothetical protein
MDVPPLDKVILLALADHGHDDGTSIFPSVAATAIKCSVSTRTVQRIVGKYRRCGVLALVAEAAGHQPRQYRFVFRGDSIQSPRLIVAPTVEVADHRSGVTVEAGTVPAQKLLRSKATVKKRTVTLSRAWPEDFDLTEKRANYARTRGCRNPALQWEQFHDDCLKHGTRFVDWDAGWRTRCRNHWCPCREGVVPIEGPSLRDMARGVR